MAISDPTQNDGISGKEENKLLVFTDESVSAFRLYKGQDAITASVKEAIAISKLARTVMGAPYVQKEALSEVIMSIYSTSLPPSSPLPSFPPCPRPPSFSPLLFLHQLFLYCPLFH